MGEACGNRTSNPRTPEPSNPRTPSRAPLSCVPYPPSIPQWVLGAARGMGARPIHMCCRRRRHLFHPHLRRRRDRRGPSRHRRQHHHRATATLVDTTISAAAATTHPQPSPQTSPPSPCARLLYTNTTISTVPLPPPPLQPSPPPALSTKPPGFSPHLRWDPGGSVAF